MDMTVLECCQQQQRYTQGRARVVDLYSSLGCTKNDTSLLGKNGVSNT